MRRPGKINLGSGQFARIEGHFTKRTVALAHLYPTNLKQKNPILLYGDEARKLAAWLTAFADWFEEHELATREETP